jgi:hypothetical protein
MKIVYHINILLSSSLPHILLLILIKFKKVLIPIQGTKKADTKVSTFGGTDQSLRGWDSATRR